MSRPKNFPEKLYVGMSKQQSALFIFDKKVADALTALGEKVAVYEIAPVPGKPLKAPKPAQIPTVAPKEQDTQPQGQPGGKDRPLPSGTTTGFASLDTAIAIGKGRHRKGPSSAGYGPPLVDP